MSFFLILRALPNRYAGSSPRQISRLTCFSQRRRYAAVSLTVRKRGSEWSETGVIDAPACSLARKCWPTYLRGYVYFVPALGLPRWQHGVPAVAQEGLVGYALTSNSLAISICSVP